MKDINNVVMVARLVRDAEMKYTSGGCAILNFSIAVNRSVKKDDEWIDEVSFFDYVLFGKRAEGLAQYMLKGKQVAIDGSLKQDRWEQEGKSRSKVNILVDNLQFVGGRQESAKPVDDFVDDIPFTDMSVPF